MSKLAIYGLLFPTVCWGFQTYPIGGIGQAFVKSWFKSTATSATSSDDVTSSPAFLKKKLDVLKKEKATLEADLAATKDLQATVDAEWGQPIKNLLSEYSFLQQRTFNETRDADIVARVSVVKEILPVLDNFDRAESSLTAADDAQEAIIGYYSSVLSKINEVLSTYDLSVVPSVGHPFDYNVHEAIQQVPSDEYDEDVVCQEFQKGYMIGEKLVRPAIVAVSIGDM